MRPVIRVFILLLACAEPLAYAQAQKNLSEGVQLAPDNALGPRSRPAAKSRNNRAIDTEFDNPVDPPTPASGSPAPAPIAPATVSPVAPKAPLVPPSQHENEARFRVIEKAFKDLADRRRKDEKFKVNYGPLVEAIEGVSQMYGAGIYAPNNTELQDALDILAIHYFGAQKSLAKARMTTMKEPLEEADKALKLIIQSQGGSVDREADGEEVFTPAGTSASRDMGNLIASYVSRLNGLFGTLSISGAEQAAVKEIEEKALLLKNTEGTDLNYDVDMAGQALIDTAERDDVADVLEALKERFKKNTEVLTQLNFLTSQITALSLTKTYGKSYQRSNE